MDSRLRLLLAIVAALSAMLAGVGAAAGDGRVSLSLYYETLCPFCSNFIVNYLSKIFGNGLSDIVHLNLVPFGNAFLFPNNSISCQHGPYECLLNTVEACAINRFPDVRTHFSFIKCVENLVLEQKYGQWESCFQQTGLDSRAIVNCYNSGYGLKLELQYAAQTNALVPPHKFVPWVAVNGRPLYEDYQKFAAYVCKAYQGALPAACKTLSSEIQENRQDEFKSVTYLKRPDTIQQLH